MARRIKAKEILELHSGWLSRNAIAATRHMLKHSVQGVLEAAFGTGFEPGRR